MEINHSSCESIMPQQVTQIFLLGDVHIHGGVDVVLALSMLLNVGVVVLVALFRKQLKR